MLMLKKLVGCVAPEPSDISHVDRSAILNKSHFIVASVLGEGGFGRVMACTCVKNSEWYAVKEIDKANLLKHKTGVDMLNGEIESMKRLSSPFIINLHFAFNDPVNCYLVLDLKTGGDLRYYLRRRYLFEEIDVAFYVACLSSALEHIHANGIIHRDVKPENVLLDERGYVCLTDFGVAHVQQEGDSKLVSTLASGTRQYLAPEVFTKSHIHGPEMDYWGLGVVAYELLFGRRPFDKHCPIQMINYLERALAAKRKYKKELAMKTLTSRSADASSGSPTTCSSPSFLFRRSFDACHGSASPATAGIPPSVIVAPSPLCKASRADTDSPSRFQASFCTRPSSEATTGERGTLVFCSSVSCSPRSSIVSNHSEDMSREEKGHTASLSTDGRASFGSPVLEDQELVVLPSAVKVSSISNPVGCTSMLARSPRERISALKASLLHSPTRSQHRPSHPSSSAMSSIVPSGCSSPSTHPPSLPPQHASSHHHHHHHPPHPHPPGPLADRLELLLPDDLVAHSHSLSDDEESGSDGSGRKYMPVDHWLVDDGKLPSSLRVSIPRLNPWLGELSENCLEVLKGLFEVRPSHRLGTRDYEHFQRLAWFQQLGDWDGLMDRTYEPHFQPGKRFMREIMESMGNVVHAHFLGEAAGKKGADDKPPAAVVAQQQVDPEQPSPAEQAARLEECFYIAPKYRSTFRCKKDCQPCSVGAELSL